MSYKHFFVYPVSPPFFTAWMLPDVLCEWANASMGALRWQMCTYQDWATNDKFVSGAIQRTGAWEPHLVGAMLSILTSRIHRTVRPRPRLVDVGANIGFYSLAAASAGADVHAFEPVPRNAAMLQMSIEKNRLQHRIRVHAFAASDVPKTLTMGRSLRNQGGVFHAANATHAQSRLPGIGGTILAAFGVGRLVDATDELTGQRIPTFLKVDAESSECAIVRGLAQWAAATELVGVMMEMKLSTKRCCHEEKWYLEGGFFHTLRVVHALRSNAHTQNFDGCNASAGAAEADECGLRNCYGVPAEILWT